MSYVLRERAEMFARIRKECELEYAESMEEEGQLNVLIGLG